MELYSIFNVPQANIAVTLSEFLVCMVSIFYSRGLCNLQDLRRHYDVVKKKKKNVLCCRTCNCEPSVVIEVTRSMTL